MLSLCNLSRIKFLSFNAFAEDYFVLLSTTYMESLLDVNIELHRKGKFFPVVEWDLLLVFTDEKQGQETRYACYFWMLERFDFLPDKLHTIC